MPSYSKNEVILVRYPFSDLSATKVRPAVVVHAPHPSQDSLIVPLTKKIGLCEGGNCKPLRFRYGVKFPPLHKQLSGRESNSMVY